jgi:hypothetical protein
MATSYRCLHSKTFAICLINCRVEQVSAAPPNPQTDEERQATKTTVKCGIAAFTAGLSAPMSLYDLDTEQYIGHCEIPDEVRGAIVPQSFCDPEDALELDLTLE